MPFTLGETREYLQSRGVRWPEQMLAECYMVMGGIPYYLQQIDRSMSLAQNVDRMFFIMAENHRRPSKYYLEERNNWNWWRHTQKQMNAGLLKPERVELFKKMLEEGEKYRRVNQYD